MGKLSFCSFFRHVDHVVLLYLDILENYAKEMLKKKESIDGLVNRVVETKLAAALKGKVTLENKTVSMEEFNKMFE